MKSLRRSRSKAGTAIAWISVGAVSPFSCTAARTSGDNPSSSKPGRGVTSSLELALARTRTVAGLKGLKRRTGIDVCRRRKNGNGRREAAPRQARCKLPVRKSMGDSMGVGDDLYEVPKLAACRHGI